MTLLSIPVSLLSHFFCASKADLFFNGDAPIKQKLIVIIDKGKFTCSTLLAQF